MTQDEIRERFEPIQGDEQANDMAVNVRDVFSRTACQMVDVFGPSRETSLMLTKLEEACHWAVRALYISREKENG